MSPSKSKIDKGRQTVGGWLSTWDSRKRELMCAHIVGDELITLKEKQALYPYKATYLKHAIGEYARVRLGISTVMLSLGSKEEYMPMPSLLDVTQRVVNSLTGGFYEEENKKWRRGQLRNTIKQEMLKWIDCGIIDKSGKDLVRVEPVIPELVVLNHFAPVIYHSCGKSSWKRCVTSAIVGTAPGVEFAEIPGLIREHYSGQEYNYRKRKDLQTWWLIHGDDGSMFAIKDIGGYAYLQYSKRVHDKDIEMNSVSFQSILRTVKALPFIDQGLLTQLFGTSAYLHFLEVMKKYPEATPLKLGESFVHQGQAFLLRLGLKADIEEHPMTTIISAIYKQCQPRIGELEDFGITIRNLVHEMAANQEFVAKEYRERIVGRALVTLGFADRKPTTETFLVKEGMRDATATLSRFAGNIFDK